MPPAYELSKPEDQDRPKSWRDVLPVHPAAELFPLIGKDELRELADDIAKHGLREKVDLYWDRDNKAFLIDGRNRLDALALLERDLFDDKGKLRHELQSTPPPRLYSEADCIAYIVSKNVHRRHLTNKQKRDLIAKVLKAKPEISNLQIAKQVKGSDKTVAKVRTELETTSQIPKLTKTVGKDGKSRPVRQKRAAEKVKRLLNGSAPTPDIGENSSKPTTLKLDAFATSAKALSEFKYACDHWLPKMVPEHRSEAVKFLADLVLP